MTNTVAPADRPTNYCTTNCGRPARNDEPVSFYRRGDAQPMTLICRHR